jgi:hypothetical protein
MTREEIEKFITIMKEMEKALLETAGANHSKP